jgi:hypothetical protein
MDSSFLVLWFLSFIYFVQIKFIIIVDDDVMRNAVQFSSSSWRHFTFPAPGTISFDCTAVTGDELNPRLKVNAIKTWKV